MQGKILWRGRKYSLLVTLEGLLDLESARMSEGRILAAPQCSSVGGFGYDHFSVKVSRISREIQSRR